MWMVTTRTERTSRSAATECVVPQVDIPNPRPLAALPDPNSFPRIATAVVPSSGANDSLLMQQHGSTSSSSHTSSTAVVGGHLLHRQRDNLAGNNGVQHHHNSVTNNVAHHTLHHLQQHSLTQQQQHAQHGQQKQLSGTGTSAPQHHHSSTGTGVQPTAGTSQQVGNHTGSNNGQLNNRSMHHEQQLQFVNHTTGNGQQMQPRGSVSPRLVANFGKPLTNITQRNGELNTVYKPVIRNNGNNTGGPSNDGLR
eukprot:Lankesteria_metandrocarpae@DN6297_c0_g1_i1.p1